jgi:uncharacterized membrane protein YedE/YeeE
MFDSPGKLVLGFLTGVVFGFLLQKGRVAKYHVIVSQFLLKDWTVVKIMASAVVTGSIGVYVMQQFGWIELSVRPAAFGGVILGGVLFGVGMTVLGLCPGTSVAACGEGRRDAPWGVLGMLFGAGLYVALFQALQAVVKVLGDWGKVTLPAVTHTSPWIWLGGLLIAGILLRVLLGRRHEGESTSAEAATTK